MIKLAKILGFILGLSFSSGGLSQTGVGIAATAAKEVICPGKFFDFINDTNWLLMFPITIAGVKGGPYSRPPLHYVPPLWVCEYRLGFIPVLCTGVTYWAPKYIAEVERNPGCFSSLGGGKPLLPGFSLLASEKAGGENAGGSSSQASRMQIHWYKYPVMALIKTFLDMPCSQKGESKIDIAAITEIDPLWQNDLWSAVLTPESGFFANLLAQTSCIADAIAANVYFPIDAMFWCVGSAGALYPMSGTAGHHQSDQSSNMLVLAKFVARHHRVTALWGTIGPTNWCGASPAPIWIKSQYRLNQIWPTQHKGPPVYFGQSEFKWGLVPPANFPTRESSSYLLWVAVQCCANMY